MINLVRRLFGTHKSEKKLVKHLRIFVIDSVSVLMEDGRIDEDNYENWLEIFKFQLLAGTQDEKIWKKWFEQHEVSKGAAKTAFYIITNEQHRNYGELFYVLAVEEATIIDREIEGESFMDFCIEMKILRTKTATDQFKV